MPLADVFSRIAGAVFGAPADPADKIDQTLLDDAVDAIVEAVEPRIRFMPRYRRRLEPVARRTIAFMRSLAPALPAAIELSQKAWSVDPRIGAFFATGTDIATLLARCEALVAFFNDAANSQYDTAHCLLGMRREEHNVIAAALVDGEVRRDMARTTVSFTDHKLLAITAEPLATRRLVGQAILERMALLALERIVAKRDRATELDTRHGVLTTRLRMLTLRRGPLRELAPGEKDPSQDIASVERELAAVVEARRDVKESLATLDYSIEQIGLVFGEPQNHLALNTIEMRVSHTGFKMNSAGEEPGTDLRLNELSIGPVHAVIVLVTVPRGAMPRKATH